MRRLVLLVAGLHAENCQEQVTNMIRAAAGVLDVKVTPILRSQHGSVSVGCEYGIAQVIFDPDKATSARILFGIKPPYWADVIAECPMEPAEKSSEDERRRVALFA